MMLMMAEICKLLVMASVVSWRQKGGAQIFCEGAKHCIRASPKWGRYWEIHPWRPRDFPRPERFPEGEARWKSRGPSVGGVRTFSIINPSTGMDQEIHPCGQGRMDSVKINPSLLRMREWAILTAQALIGDHIDNLGTIACNAIPPSLTYPTHAFIN